MDICITSPESIVAIVSTVVAGASAFANLIPAPENITNPTLRFLSRVVHFVAFDIVTAAQKK